MQNVENSGWDMNNTVGLYLSPCPLVTIAHTCQVIIHILLAGLEELMNGIKHMALNISLSNFHLLGVYVGHKQVILVNENVDGC